MRARRLWACFWSWANSVTIRVKIMGIVLAMTLILGSSVTFHVRATLTSSLRGQLQQNAIAIGRDVAARSADLLLTNDLFALHQLVRDTLENNRDVRYVFVTDSAGVAAADSFGGRLPPGLLAANSVRGERRFRLQVLDTEEGPIHDVALPIMEGRAGFVRLGMSEQRLWRVVGVVTTRLTVATLLVSFAGMIMAAFLTSILARPVRELVEVAAAVGGGGFDRRARVWAKDEIGQLGIAFNTMIENLSRSHQELKEKEVMRLGLLKKVISAQEEERKRVARELHDQTSQSLASLMLSLRALEAAPSLEKAREKAVELRSSVGELLKEVHRLAFELRPSSLDDLGLVAATQRYVEEFASRSGLMVDYEALGLDDEGLPMEVETALYRIIQEALTNVAKHANCKHVSVVLQRQRDSVVAIIEDDGRGFDVQKTTGPDNAKESLGLFGMHERASLVGGRLTIESSPERGTAVFVSVPVESSQGHAE